MHENKNYFSFLSKYILLSKNIELVLQQINLSIH
jgi:hypothetical protein